MILNLYYPNNLDKTTISPFWYNSVNKPTAAAFNIFTAQFQTLNLTNDPENTGPGWNTQVGLVIENLDVINPSFIISYPNTFNGVNLGTFTYAMLQFDNTAEDTYFYFIKSFKKWNMSQVRIELELDFWCNFGLEIYDALMAKNSTMFIERMSLPRYLYDESAKYWYVDFQNQFWLWKDGSFDHLKKNQLPLSMFQQATLNNEYGSTITGTNTVPLMDWDYSINGPIIEEALNPSTWVDNSWGKYLIAIANTNGIKAINGSSMAPQGHNANTDYLYICTTSDTYSQPTGNFLNTFELPSSIKQAVIYLPFSPFYKPLFWLEPSPLKLFTLAAITAGDPEIQNQNAVCYSLATLRNCSIPNHLNLTFDSFSNNNYMNTSPVLSAGINALFANVYKPLFNTNPSTIKYSVFPTLPDNTINSWQTNPLFLNEQYMRLEFNYGGSVQTFNFLTMTPYFTTFNEVPNSINSGNIQQFTINMNSLISPTEQAVYLNNATWFYQTTNPYFFLPLTSEFPTSSNAWLTYLNSNLSSYNTSQNQIKLNIAQSGAELASNLTFSGLGLADSIRNDADFFSSAGGALSVAESATNAAISDGFSIAQSQLAIKQLTTNAKSDMNRQSNINLTGNPNIYMNLLREYSIPYTFKIAPNADLIESANWYFLWGYECNNYLPFSATNVYNSFNFFKTKHSISVINTLQIMNNMAGLNFISGPQIANVIAKMFDEGIRLWNVPFNLNISNLENEGWTNPWL